MKKCITALLLLFTLSITSLFACTSADKPESAAGKTSKSTSDKRTKLTPVTLNEVAHSIFYAPMYVAIEKNYFEKEGIDLSLVTGFGVMWLVQNILFI